MVADPVTAPPTHLTRGGVRAGRNCPRRGVQARFYAFPCRTEAVTSNAVITGMVPICHRDALVLFDLGCTYSYLLSYFAPYLDISRDSLSFPIYVSKPVGDSIVVDRVYRSCLAVIVVFEIVVYLLSLSMVDFDVILGINWLSPHHAILDFHAKTVTLAMTGFPRLELRGALDYGPSRFVSFLKAQQMV
ncbi:uncharacterized protein [Nicotiana tomentosiformis]|uniref:uncharacterized protein n=1 Tax=Nicotiana tomentosiformis TaxID=4098 RepID=UPI00388C836C